ncbi:hypothetical protein T459_01938 [Capsicum annuum]|uniref:Aldehyde dehydrogenase domain-containing protein n=1 Tax=Capsicum annuum TaxID=4072 RepID=A0A2G3AII0_CAPAN|nr:hypothetical protein T459_01938 [Capsicum annuum]
MLSWKVGPALACGNTIVLKTAEQNPLSAFYVANLLQKAGLPEGILNVISGFDTTAGGPLCSHMDMDKVPHGFPRIALFTPVILHPTKVKPVFSRATNEMIEYLRSETNILREQVDELRSEMASMRSWWNCYNVHSLIYLFCKTTRQDIHQIVAGMSSGSSVVSSHDSTQPSGSRSNSFIIQQFYYNLSARTAAKRAGYPNLVEQVSGSDPRDGPKRVAA